MKTATCPSVKKTLVGHLMIALQAAVFGFCAGCWWLLGYLMSLPKYAGVFSDLADLKHTVGVDAVLTGGITIFCVVLCTVCRSNKHKTAIAL